MNHCRMTNILQFIREWFYLCHNVNLHSNRTSKSKIYITTSIIGRPVCIILNVYMYISNMYERSKIWHTKLLVFKLTETEHRVFFQFQRYFWRSFIYLMKVYQNIWYKTPMLATMVFHSRPIRAKWLLDYWL